MKEEDCSHVFGKWEARFYEVFVGWVQFRSCQLCGASQGRIIARWDGKA